MFLFGRKSPHTFVGVDMGASGVKMVELANERGRARLFSYGFTEALPLTEGKTLLDDPAKAAEVMVEVMKKAGIKGTRVVASLPTSSVYNAVIAIPEPKTQEAAKPLIEAQARKLLPVPYEEMVLSWTFIDPVKKETVLKKKVGKTSEEEQKLQEAEVLAMVEREKKQEKNVRVLLTAAPRALVGRYTEAFKKAKLTLAALDTEAHGLIRALIGKDRSTILLVDMGATRTNLTVVEKGNPFFTRSVQMGGVAFTKSLAELLGVPLEQAEQMKVDLSVAGDPRAVSPLLQKVYGQLVNEIRYVFEQYQRQEFSDNKRVEKIILTGGSAQVPGLAEYLKQTLNLNTYLGDPWARVVVPQDLRLLLDTIGPSMAIAVGLGMREMGEGS